MSEENENVDVVDDKEVELQDSKTESTQQEPPKFTDKDMAELRRKESRARKQQKKEFEARIKELEEKFSSIQSNSFSDLEIKDKEKSEPSDVDNHAKLLLLDRRFQQTIKDHEKEREEFKKQIEILQEKNRKDRLDFELTEALAGKTDNIRAAKRYFMPDIEWDDLDERYVIRDEKDHNLVPLKEAIELFMPDELRKSRVQRGGSGGSGIPSKPRDRKAAALKNAEEEMKNAHTKAAETRAEHDITLYLKKQREYKRLKQQYDSR